MAVTVAAAASLSACAAGQHAQTAEERPTIDGYYGSIGDLKLGGVSLAAPSGPTWPYGASVPLTMYISSEAKQPDRLLDVSSPNFSGWRVVPSSAVSSSAAPSAGASTSASAPGPLDTGSPSPQTIPPGKAVSFSLSTAYGAAGSASSKVLLMTGLKAQIYPAQRVMVTLKFQHAGTRTIPVLVQISSTPASESVSGTETSGAAGING